jgi:hypothetical protein
MKEPVLGQGAEFMERWIVSTGDPTPCGSQPRERCVWQTGTCASTSTQSSPSSGAMPRAAYRSRSAPPALRNADRTVKSALRDLE